MLYLTLMDWNEYSPSCMKKNTRTDHPGPWQSELWDHLEEIRSLRRSPSNVERDSGATRREARRSNHRRRCAQFLRSQ
jgi:hypothetical protein